LSAWITTVPLGFSACRRSIIERLHAENPKGTVVIQADKQSRNDALVQVMDASRRAGVYDIALAANDG